jgi:hypothetical protein
MRFVYGFSFVAILLCCDFLRVPLNEKLLSDSNFLSVRKGRTPIINRARVCPDRFAPILSSERYAAVLHVVARSLSIGDIGLGDSRQGRGGHRT